MKLSTGNKIKVFDFYSGCGGTSQGFKKAGMDIIFATDNDPDAGETFKVNFPEAEFWLKDIRQLTPEDLIPVIRPYSNAPKLFCGCAPCQPFTKQNTNRQENDKRIPLLYEFKKFVEFYLPEFVFVENVPGMQKIDNTENPFNNFVKFLKSSKYHVKYDIVLSMNYGVPQKRRRLVMIASLNGEIDLPQKTNGPGTENLKYSTVRDWISYLPHIKAGETHSEDPYHRAAMLSPLNLQRISFIKEGESRMNWPEDLRLNCHKKYSGHTDVYGRMKWGEPATGLTTRCISLSNGRFGHPEQNRAISVREAALLQIFPKHFVFYGSLSSMSRQVGNAVPVQLAKVFGHNFINHLNSSTQGSV